MPRSSILSAAERVRLLALPDTEDEHIRHYTFSEPDLSVIRQRRGDANHLGVAVQLCLLGLLQKTENIARQSRIILENSNGYLQNFLNPSCSEHEIGNSM